MTGRHTPHEREADPRGWDHHRIDWSLYGDQTPSPDRLVRAVCGQTIAAEDACDECTTCPHCLSGKRESE